MRCSRAGKGWYWWDGGNDEGVKSGDEGVISVGWLGVVGGCVFGM